MKALILIIVFLIVPLIIVNAQDNKVTEKTVNDHAGTEVKCSDCQGWGWLIIVKPQSDLRNNSFSGSILRNVALGGTNSYSVEYSQVRTVCPYCGGKGKFLVK